MSKDTIQVRVLGRGGGGGDWDDKGGKIRKEGEEIWEEMGGGEGGARDGTGDARKVYLCNMRVTGKTG